MNALEFLRAIYHACSDEFTYIWTRTNQNTVKRTRSFNVSELETLIKVARKINLCQMHVSFSMGLLDHPLGTYERAKSTDIVAIPCLWCDIDIADAVHGQNQKLVPSVEDAIAILPADLYPSIIVDSGFGIHAYWIFDHLLPTTTDSERSRAKKLLEQMQSIIRHNAGEYFIDPTADLSRMLRLPDTVNWKAPNKKDAPICKVIDASNIVYPIDDLESRLQSLIDKLLPKTENPREISISQKDFLNSHGNSSITDSISQESAEKLFENCSFCRFCRDNIATLSHAEFLDFFPNLLKAKDGFDIADSLCKIRFGEKYDQRKTRLHIDSLSSLTPITCDRIASLHPSCDQNSCIVKKSGKNSPCAILLSPKIKHSINADFIGDIFPNAPDSIRNLQMPDGFSLSKSCIIDNRGKSSKSIIDTPIIVSREISFANTDKPAFYEVFYLKRDIWRKSIVKPTVLSDSKLLVNILPNEGILISSKQAGNATDFFMAFIRQNESSIPRVNIFDKLGWHRDKFILPTLNNGEYLISDTQSNDKIQRHGDRDSSVALLKEVFQYPYARILIDANLAAPLLELVNCRNFILDLICRSHQGKSSALLFANSLWGKREWMVNFNATANAAEEFSAARNSLPTNIDEWQLTDQKRRAEIANQIVHRFSEGEGRARLNRDGTPKPIKSWHGIMIMTSEEPLTSDNSFQGVKTRVLEIQANTILGHVNSDRKIELNHELCTRIWDIALKHYGILGAEFMEKLMNEFKDDPHFKRLKTEYDINFDIIMETRDDRIIASYAQYLAIIACADIRAQLYFLEIDENNATRSTIKFIEFIAKQLPTEHSQLDTERAKLAIIDWTNAYADHFKKWKDPDKNADAEPENSKDNQSFSINFCKDPCFGYWIHDDLYVIPSELNKALTDRGFSSQKIIKEWAQNEEIEVESGSGRLSILKTIEPGVRKRVIGLSFLHDDENEFTQENELIFEKRRNDDYSGTDDDDSDDPAPF